MPVYAFQRQQAHRPEHTRLLRRFSSQVLAYRPLLSGSASTRFQSVRDPLEIAGFFILRCLLGFIPFIPPGYIAATFRSYVEPENSGSFGDLRVRISPSPSSCWSAEGLEIRASPFAVRNSGAVRSLEVSVKLGERSACVARGLRLLSPRSGRGESRRSHIVDLSQVPGHGWGSFPSSVDPPTNTGSELELGFVAIPFGAGGC